MVVTPGGWWRAGEGAHQRLRRERRKTGGGAGAGRGRKRGCLVPFTGSVECSETAPILRPTALGGLESPGQGSLVSLATSTSTRVRSGLPKTQHLAELLPEVPTSPEPLSWPMASPENQPGCLPWMRFSRTCFYLNQLTFRADPHIMQALLKRNQLELEENGFGFTSSGTYVSLKRSAF